MENKEFMNFIVEGDGIPEGKQRCKECGELIGSGLIPGIQHGAECFNKGLAELFQDYFDKSGTITQKDANAIIDYHNNNRIKP